MTYPLWMTEEPRVRATVCHACHGHGSVLRAAARSDGSTTLVHIPCRWCDGTGRLSGFVPPC